MLFFASKALISLVSLTIIIHLFILQNNKRHPLKTVLSHEREPRLILFYFSLFLLKTKMSMSNSYAICVSRLLVYHHIFQLYILAGIQFLNAGHFTVLTLTKENHLEVWAWKSHPPVPVSKGLTTLSTTRQEQLKP